MNLTSYEKELNRLLNSIDDIQERLYQQEYTTEYNASTKVRLEIKDDAKAYQTLDKAFNYVIKNINDLVIVVCKLGAVDFMTGKEPTVLMSITLKKLVVQNLIKRLDLVLNEMTNKVDSLKALLAGYGYLVAPLIPKEDFDVLPKSSWRVITGKTGNGSRYWRTEIKNAKMGVGFAHDIATGGISEYETAQEFAKRHNLPVVSNASRFSYNASGAVATKGKPQAKRMHKGKVFARNWNDAYTQYLTIESDGKTLGTKPNGVDFKNGDFEEVLLAFYPLFEDGEPSARPVVDTKYESELSEQPRQILYQLQDNTFGILTISARVDGDKGASYEQMIEELQKIGNVKFAYNLDGGGSAANVIEGEMLNPTFDPRSPDGRPVQDFIYFYSDQIEDPVTSTVIPLDD